MQGHVFQGRYKTIRLLGEGGMGRVYLAHDPHLEREVVIKVMHDHIAADPTFRDRFVRETLLTAQFTHPYAVTVYDADPNDAHGPFILMEYIRGETLDTVLARNRRLDPTRVNRLLHMLGEVLFAAHNKGIIHRDLKPANLMVVDPDTQYEMVKVMDFGLAKLLGPQQKAQVTNAEFAVGTPGYMCPEQARGEDMDHRGDLYAVGVILYEVLTGQLPFAGRETMDILIAHATEDPPSFAAVGALGVVPAPIERVVQSCLAKDPNDRPSTARELAEMFAEALAGHQPMTMTPGAWHQPAPTGAPQPRVPRLRLARPAPAPAPAGPGAPVAVASLQSAVMPAVAEPVVVKAPTPILPATDPLSVVHHLEAWMPEVVASYKLRGFLNEVGGELVESVPGRINVRLGGKNCTYAAPSRGLSWLGLGRRPLIDVEMRLQRIDPTRESQLKITVVFRSPGNDLSADVAWRSVCSQIFCDLRAHLMAQGGPNNEPG
jgi:eukaryotic-like serine/threonine-protein kinase